MQPQKTREPLSACLSSGILAILCLPPCCSDVESLEAVVLDARMNFPLSSCLCVFLCFFALVVLFAHIVYIISARLPCACRTSELLAERQVHLARGTSIASRLLPCQLRGLPIITASRWTSSRHTQAIGNSCPSPSISNLLLQIDAKSLEHIDPPYPDCKWMHQLTGGY